MPVKDKIVTWYIQNILIPKREIIDNPGFIITTFTEDNQTTYLRDLFLPEELFVMIENEMIRMYGETGKQTLYSIGKKFSYQYAGMSRFPTINDVKKEKFEEFAYLFIRFIEGTYAKKAQHEIDIENKLFKITLGDYIICRNNGHGYIMTSGSSAGTWSYEMQDKSIEGCQVKCQGRNDTNCYVLCGPVDEIKKQCEEVFIEKDLQKIEYDESFRVLNKIRTTNYSKNSLKDLLDNGFLEYKRGRLTYNKKRFFLCDAHLLYILEEEISRLDKGEENLFDICFNYGKKLRQLYGDDDFERFITDFFPALGFGDIFLLEKNKYKIGGLFYPWTIFSEKSKYIVFRGIMSGLLSDSLKEKVEFKNFEIDLSDSLTLTIYE